MMAVATGVTADKVRRSRAEDNDGPAPVPAGPAGPVAAANERNP